MLTEVLRVGDPMQGFLCVESTLKTQGTVCEVVKAI